MQEYGTWTSIWLERICMRVLTTPAVGSVDDKKLSQKADELMGQGIRRELG